MVHSSTTDQLTEAFRAGLARNEISAALQSLLVATEGNAVGVWRRVGHDLVVLGFAHDAAFPADVGVEFAAATQKVSLNQTGLGIVHAVLTEQPAVALLPSQGGLLPGSGGWLERFGSVQSLSVPIAKDGKMVAVLALSSRHRFQPADPTWKILTDLAAEISTLL